jgi:hypothetical protein
MITGESAPESRGRGWDAFNIEPLHATCHQQITRSNTRFADEPKMP